MIKNKIVRMKFETISKDACKKIYVLSKEKSRGEMYMEENAISKLLDESTWYEKIIVKLFKKTFIKFYHINRINLINNILK